MNSIIFSKRIRWRKCLLKEVSVDGNFFAALKIISEKLSNNIVIQATTPCPALIFEKNREGHFEKLLKKNKLKRRQSKLEKMGVVSFHHISDALEIKKHLKNFTQRYIRIRALLNDPSPFLIEEQKQFYKALIEKFDPCSILRFTIIN